MFFYMFGWSISVAGAGLAKVSDSQNGQQKLRIFSAQSFLFGNKETRPEYWNNS